MRNLKEFDLFQKFSNITLARLQNMVKEKVLQEDEVIFREGEAGDALYIIAEGEVAIRRFIDQFSGRMKTIAIIEKGDFFGEMAIFDDKPRSATAMSSKKSILLALKKEDFWKVIHEEPATAVMKLLGMNRVMADRLRVANQNFITTYEIGQIVSTVKNLPDLIEMTLEQLSSAVDKSDAGFFALYDEFAGVFTITARKGAEAEKINEQELTEGDSIVKDILINKRSIYIQNTDDSKLYPDLVKKSYDGKSLIVSPVVWDDKLLGIIFVISFKEYNAFNQANKLLIGTIARQISAAINDLKNKVEEENRKKLQEKKYQY